MDKIETLYQSPQRIFTLQDLRVIWREPNPDTLKSLASYYVRVKKLIRLRRGLYSLGHKIDWLEVAQNLIHPSYITLESALYYFGIIYQKSNTISCFAPYNKIIPIQNWKFSFHQAQDKILYAPQGLIQKKTFTIASAERALTDWLYLRGESHFDRLDKINKDKLLEMTDIYQSKAVEKRILKITKML